ncbi:hypothetical protein EKO27_g4162 [Xylaria grammica]|uniref:EXPERA domain-containing protein n=1 Tax=Xylaria grammica TaxID=363999 RepID=A0A439D964_9PEZI|nr:hypothetical protein EKO27_g4162 [Xylaria grammica]
MASSTRPVLDRVYLVYFLIHIPVMFLVDLVPLYPASLWVPADAPLHALWHLRQYYIENYNDQFFLPPPAEIPSFFPLFAFFELVFHLPVSLWAARAPLARYRPPRPLRRRRAPAPRLRPPDGYHYSHVHVRGRAVGPRRRLVRAEDGPPVLLTADMYSRVLKRVNAADAVKKTQ